MSFFYLLWYTKNKNFWRIFSLAIKKRSNVIDIMKGIGILLVILGHCMPYENPLNRFIYSFHMPLFFMISGYLYNEKYIDKQKEYILSKLKMFLIYFIIPLCVFVFINNFLYNMGFYTNIYESQLPNHSNISETILFIIKSTFYLQSLSAMSGFLWFIRTLCVVLIIFNFSNKLFKNNIIYNQILLSIVSIILFYSLKIIFNDNLFLNIFLAYPFIVLGYLFNKNKDIFDKISKKYISPLLLLFFILITSTFPHNRIDFYGSLLDNLPLLLSVNVIMFIVITLISKEINNWKHNKHIIFIGRNSILFLIIHGLILKFITLILFELIKFDKILLSRHFVPQMPYPLVIIYFISCTIISYTIIAIYLKIKVYLKNKIKTVDK